MFRMNLGSEPPSLDPARVNDLTSFTVLQNLMRGLTVIGPDGRAIPAVASRWDRLDGGRRYVFHLRRDALWEDGRPVTAQDFVYAWRRALDPALASEYAYFLFEVQNAKAWYDGKLGDFNAVGVHAPDPYTLDVRLTRAIPFFLDLMASPVALPLREDVVARAPQDFTEAGRFVANGPYRLSRWRHEESLRLTPNPAYYGSHPQVKAVEMAMIADANASVIMYENGELDFIETTTSIPAFDARRLRARPEARTRLLHRLSYVGFNAQAPPFNDPRVRRAFALAIDRSAFPKLLKSGQRPWNGWISPGLPCASPEAGLGYDPAAARRLLAEAGYPDGRGFPRVSLAFQTQYDLLKEGEILQSQWKQTLNVPVALENMEWKAFLTRLRQNPPAMFRLGWFADYLDADSFMGMMTRDSRNNYTGWGSAEYDRLVAKAAITGNLAGRQALYDAAQVILLRQDVVIAPLYASEKLWLVNPRASGVRINALNLIDLERLSLPKPN